MMKYLAGLIAFFCCELAHAEDVYPDRPTLEEFLISGRVADVELSPNGELITSVIQSETATTINTYKIPTDIDAEDISLEAAINAGAVRINWVKWVTNDRLLVSARYYVNRYGASVPIQKVNDPEWWDRGNYAIKVTRLYFVNLDGENMVQVFDGNRSLNKNFNIGNIVSYLNGDPDHVMISTRSRGSLNLYKVNIYSGKYELVGDGTSKTVQWFLDSNGVPAFRFDVNRRWTRVTVYRRQDRENGKLKWRKLKTIRFNDGSDDERTQGAEFNPIAPGPTLTTYYVAARPEGMKTTGIYLYDFEKDEYIETLKTHPKIDIENAIISRTTNEYLGTYYYEDRLKIEYEDRQLQKHIDGLDNYFGNEASVVPVDRSEDDNIWLLFASGPRDPGSYHLYFKQLNHANSLGSAKPHLNETRLAQMTVETYKARDGLEITGYYTAPIGLLDGQVPPLIMMPHGGPEMRDFYDYSDIVQILAAQGYAVFQPNFRGSSGYGGDFAEAGYGQWGKDMQTDLDDGLSYLISKRLALPGEACILGYSYGGYAALMAGATTPESYKCVIAGAAVSDLIAQMKFDRKEEGANSEAYKYWLKSIGDPKKNKDALEAVSPTNLAHMFEDPVLLIHGENDYTVPIKQMRMMRKSLEKHSKSVEVLEMEFAGHSYRSDEDEKLEYETILSFLSRHLPVNSPQVHEPN